MHVERYDAVRAEPYKIVAETVAMAEALHGARHSYATIPPASGVRPDLVSRALGHASTGFMLGVYTHPSGEEELATADRIGAAFEQEEAAAER
jgi:integrase